MTTTTTTTTGLPPPLPPPPPPPRLQAPPIPHDASFFTKENADFVSTMTKDDDIRRRLEDRSLKDENDDDDDAAAADDDDTTEDDTQNGIANDVNHDDNTNDKDDDENSSDHDDWRIALYYHYMDLMSCSGSTPRRQQQQQQQRKFHEFVEDQRQLCVSLNLKGRIRISHEGINGVLSGKHDALKVYTDRTTTALTKIAMKIKTDSDDKQKEGDDRDGNDAEDYDDEADDQLIHHGHNGSNSSVLDVKYCRLRCDLPIQAQLFDSLVVKETQTVISLFNNQLHPQQQQQQRQRRGGRRRRKQQRSPQKETNNGIGSKTDDDDYQEVTINESVSNNHECNDDVNGDDDDDNNHTNPLELEHLQNTVMHRRLHPAIGSSSITYTAINNNDISTLPYRRQPCRHLTPYEWNRRLDQAPPHTALLVDVRNVYESRVGYFAHPTIPTLLTNTRKYSDLPHLFASLWKNDALTNDDDDDDDNDAPSILHRNNDDIGDTTAKHHQKQQQQHQQQGQIRLRDCQQVFLYCTGGVRCERVSLLVQELYPDKQVFQLQGGIQRYLEHTVDGMAEVQTGAQMERSDVALSGKMTAGTTNHDNGTTTTPTAVCHFRGKNFVFDPRRTDPIFDTTSASTNDQDDGDDDANAIDMGVVGRCLACHKPHDDYDNGHAPNDHKEARCVHCRMLVLICNNCRPLYRCHGETMEYCGEKGDNTKGGATQVGDADEDEKRRPLSNARKANLYCHLDHCGHEGSTPDVELVGGWNGVE